MSSLSTIFIILPRRDVSRHPLRREEKDIRVEALRIGPPVHLLRLLIALYTSTHPDQVDVVADPVGVFAAKVLVDDRDDDADSLCGAVSRSARGT